MRRLLLVLFAALAASACCPPSPSTDGGDDGGPTGFGAPVDAGTGHDAGDGGAGVLPPADAGEDGGGVLPPGDAGTKGGSDGGGCVPACAGKGCGGDGCGGSCGSCASNQYCDAAGKCHASNVEHVVLIVQENHSFDSYFGSWCEAAPGSNPTCTSGPACCEAAPVTEPSGTSPGVLDDGTDNSDSNFATDRDHLQACEVQEINGGAMDQFVTGAQGAAMTCLGLGPGCSESYNWVLADGSTPGSPLYSYWQLAAQNAVADRYFQPIAGGSASNDMYFAGAHFRFVDNDDIPAVGVGKSNATLCAGGPCDSAPSAQYQLPTVADLLLQAGHSFAMYADGFDEAYTAWAGGGNCASPSVASECPYNDQLLHPAASYGCLYDPSDYPFLYYAGFGDTASGPTVYEKDISQLQQDLAQGGLPTFAFVKARLYHNEHPNLSTISDGIAFATSTIEMIEASPYAATTLVLLTWDEGGGFFDHVPPPASPPTTVDQDDSGNPVPYGTRVPLIAIGPLVRKGTVSHVQMEHSSIVKFLEWNFLGTTGQLHARDGWVDDLGSLLDPAKTGVAVPEGL